MPCSGDSCASGEAGGTGHLPASPPLDGLAGPALLAACERAATLEAEALPWRSSLEFFVNGRRVAVADAQPQQTLLSFLRDRLGLTGTKLGCGEGGCGACTVTVEQADPETRQVLHRSVNACLAPLCSVDGCAVTTVEGLGTCKQPHPVQQRLAEGHGSQCGFCTPGVVMSLYSALRGCPDPQPADIEAAFDGNLCRCTGYRPILDAARSLCHDSGRGAASGPAFPEALLAAPPRGPLRVRGARTAWYCPTDLPSLLALKRAQPDAKLVAGNTEVGVEAKFKHSEYPVLVSTAAVRELQVLGFDADGALVVGGAVTLGALERFLEHELPRRPQEATRGLQAALDMLRWFASRQIRNVAALAGNIVTASPISDLNPVLMALGAEVTLCAAGSAPRQVLLRDFLRGYRKVDMLPAEVLCSVRVPPLEGPFEFVHAYKQARRRDDDISIVNACLRVRLQPTEGGWTVRSLSAVFGGMAPTTVRAERAEAALAGMAWGEAAAEAAYEALAADLRLPESVPGGMAAYRQTLALSFFLKFYVSVSLRLAEAVVAGPPGLPPPPSIPAAERSAARNFLAEPRPVTRGQQQVPAPRGGLQHSAVLGGRDHAPAGPEDADRAPVGESLPHAAALQQCTGEAVYVDDMPSPGGALHGAFVLSERPHARLVSVDVSAAEAAPGVVHVFLARDLGEEENSLGPVLKDEELFRREVVTSTGQPIALVVAETLESAQRAARLVRVEYAELPPVLTIQDAIRAKSFHPCSELLKLECGDVEAALAAPDTVVVEGEIRIGGQEHFYLETNCALAVPGEGDELTIYASTQNPMKTQKFAAHACGVHYSKVVCRVKRMGGGFGGKETRTIFVSSAVALAAHRLRRPVRVNLERDVDMWTTGARHPFVARYRAGAGPDGLLRALDLQLYSNAGFSLDLSEAVMGRALFHSDNSYRIPSVRVAGAVCITNTASNTAFRGFGGPQGLLACEAWLEHLASALQLRPEELRARNLYAPEGDKTHFYQVLDACPLRRMWSELSESAELGRRIQEVDAFNREHRWRKRGIAQVPTKFGISFTAKFMNQGGALVHIYTDGTVLVTHGGTEMGQGLHTKVLQITAKALGIPVSDVHIRETSTETVPNSSPTAASASSDIYGMAVLDACEQLLARLRPYLERAGGNFKQAVAAAFFDRCDLSAHGFYKTPDIGFDWSNPRHDQRGTPFNYFTYGVACSEVEVDALTGDMRILRADILMDLGHSLNPAIDLGQIEGAFLQGVGWSLLEEVVWGCDELPWLRPGACLTRGPGTYKLPSSNDVPVDFRVSLLDGSPNPRAIHSSRAVGEPPLFLGASAFLAARGAIAAARRDAGCDGHFTVDTPLTPERIRMACGDRLAARFAAEASRPRPAGFW